eukprot:9308938-Pyramimonas_sp.AAC.1
MRRWHGRDFAEHDIRHSYSLRQVTRDGRGKIARAKRGYGAESAPGLEERNADKAIVKDRGECRA